jgi:hypothetical protein
MSCGFNDLVHKVLIPEHFIEHRLDVVPFICVEMHVDAAVVGEEFAEEDEPAAAESMNLAPRTLSR